MIQAPSQVNGSIMIIAGEASGDLHGAEVIKALQKAAPDIEVFGIGGRQMAAAGARILIPAETLAVVGITEALSNAPRLLKALRCARQWIRRRRPDLLLLIDFPDFNLKTAAFARKQGIPVLYYISPQIWAWRSGRVHKIKKLVNKIAVILPFEEKFFRQHGVPATFVGHPLLDQVRDKTGPGPVPAQKGRTIGLLPGSRRAEVARLLPAMLEAALKVTGRFPEARFLLSRAPSVPRAITDPILADYHGKLDLEIMKGPVSRVLDRCQLVVAASGTVTLEAAIHQTPLIIVYKVSPVSYWLGRLLINVEQIGLVNLIAGRTIAPELIQGQVNGSELAKHILEFIQNPRRLEQARSQLAEVRTALGKPGAAGRVARMAIELLEQKDVV